MPKILLTGATGYIASHTWVRLLEENYTVIGVDNFSNSNPEVLNRIKNISGKNHDEINFIQGDVCDEIFLSKLFEQHDISSVVHFAAFKAVGESVENPLKYYTNNIVGCINLINACLKYKVNNFVFSSSATVYGNLAQCPIQENSPLQATNPYGQTKLICENILLDTQKAHSEFKVAILRYFNPVGAHKSGMIGESPNGIPNNLMPYITQVAVGKREYLSIFGNDYNTKDGTGVRDYIHIIDLADGHLSAIKYLSKQNLSITVNLGTGIGYSVLDLVNIFSQTNNIEVAYKIVNRRDGDAAECYADPSLAYILMNWKAKYTLKDMCRDSWNWQINNPSGYDNSNI